MEQKTNLLFADKSQKIFSKIDFVNALTPKEIKKLNSKYLQLGLHIKQVVVDNLGNEKYEEKHSFMDLLTKKRKRRGFNSFYNFLFSYYEKESSKKNKKGKKKYSYDADNNTKLTKEELIELSDALNSLKNDMNNIEYKTCKIETDEYKEKIIDFISKFRKYISNEQYEFLLNKWKNELSKIKGVDLFDFNKNDNFMNWKVPILKGLKSEITLYALCNICNNIINGKNDKNNKCENNVIDKEKNSENDKIQKEEPKNESSDSELSEEKFEENNFNRNEALLLQCIRNANNDEENP